MSSHTPQPIRGEGSVNLPMGWGTKIVMGINRISVMFVFSCFLELPASLSGSFFAASIRMGEGELGGRVEGRWSACLSIWLFHEFRESNTFRHI